MCLLYTVKRSCKHQPLLPQKTGLDRHEVSKVSLAEQLNQLSLFTGLREHPNLISQEQNKKEKEKNNS